jgi:hypothetical protein
MSELVNKLYLLWMMAKTTLTCRELKKRRKEETPYCRNHKNTRKAAF